MSRRKPAPVRCAIPGCRRMATRSGRAVGLDGRVCEPCRAQLYRDRRRAGTAAAGPVPCADCGTTGGRIGARDHRPHRYQFRDGDGDGRILLVCLACRQSRAGRARAAAVVACVVPAAAPAPAPEHDVAGIRRRARAIHARAARRGERIEARRMAAIAAGPMTPEEWAAEAARREVRRAIRDVRAAEKARIAWMTTIVLPEPTFDPPAGGPDAGAARPGPRGWQARKKTRFFFTELRRDGGPDA